MIKIFKNKKILLSIGIITILVSTLIFIYTQTSYQNSYADEENWVYICKNSTDYTYHNHNCWVLQKCKTKISHIPESEAIELGYKPCAVCYSNEYYQPNKPGDPLPKDDEDDDDDNKDGDNDNSNKDAE